ncbi:hypothetical protein H5410_002937 [Solanum commersonii]|uniref:Endonuclease/exonuclease/phosphatase domain-containing protein n=1 Tax=Solanum commersonii TaxID=4109 RepID=A0A9J6B3K1_SOLCO|nr:hypothetical protein H5410_002937 [Solanum commersonii]
MRTQSTFHTVHMLHRDHKFFLIALMEHFQDIRLIQIYKIMLGMEYDGIHVEVVSDSEQQLTLHLSFNNENRFLVTLVCAKCTTVERLRLWDDNYDIGYNHSLPLMVEGDFNDVMGADEKCIRLDKVVTNQAMQDMLGNLEIMHFARSGSDHAPLLLLIRDHAPKIIKTFKSMRTQSTFHTVHMLHRDHKFFLIALMEHFKDIRQIQIYKIRLGMEYDGIHVEVVSDSEQQLTLHLSFNNENRFLVTLWNGRADEKCIRLDKVVTNQAMQDMLGNLEIMHFARSGSDHAPLLLLIRGHAPKIIKTFKFLKF